MERLGTAGNAFLVGAPSPDDGRETLGDRMFTSVHGPPGRLKRRLRRTLRVAAVPAVAIALLAGVMAAPAFAEPACGGKVDVSYTCLWIDPVQEGYKIHIGIDVHMSQEDAQAILDAPGDPFRARLMGSDPLFDDELFTLRLTGQGASAESGLSADFDYVASRSQLNEDDDFLDDVDDVFGKVDLVDPFTGDTRTFDSPMFHRVF
jgi:hypothetical protein